MSTHSNHGLGGLLIGITIKNEDLPWIALGIFVWYGIPLLLIGLYYSWTTLFSNSPPDDAAGPWAICTVVLVFLAVLLVYVSPKIQFGVTRLAASKQLRKTPDNIKESLRNLSINDYNAALSASNPDLVQKTIREFISIVESSREKSKLILWCTWIICAVLLSLQAKERTSSTHWIKLGLDALSLNHLDSARVYLEGSQNLADNFDARLGLAAVSYNEGRLFSWGGKYEQMCPDNPEYSEFGEDGSAMGEYRAAMGLDSMRFEPYAGLWLLYSILDKDWESRRTRVENAFNKLRRQDFDRDLYADSLREAKQAEEYCSKERSKYYSKMIGTRSTGQSLTGFLLKYRLLSARIILK